MINWKFTILYYIAVFTALLVFYSMSAEAKPLCSKHPIYCQIKSNAPKINSKYAMRLSNVIYKAARKHRINAKIYTAILAQESGYKLSAVASKRGLRKITAPEVGYKVKTCTDLPRGGDECLRSIPVYVQTRILTDFGIAQIHHSNIKIWNFDIDKLTGDLVYSIEAGAKILAEITRRYSKRESHYWTRYNASSPDKRLKYKQLVERYM